MTDRGQIPLQTLVVATIVALLIWALVIVAATRLL